MVTTLRKKFRLYFCIPALAVMSLSVIVCVRSVSADSNVFLTGNLVLSRSVYDDNPNNVTVGATLPPNCAVPASCVTAVANGTYPTVWNNAPGGWKFWHHVEDLPRPDYPFWLAD